MTVISKEKKYLGEREALEDIVKNTNRYGFSKLLVNFPQEFETDEFEIDDDALKTQGIISDTKVIQSSKFLRDVENEYFLKRGIGEDDIKAYVFLFISPIEDRNTTIAAFIIHEYVNTFSSIIYNSQTYTFVHEIGHEFGLNHVFEDDKESIANKEVYVNSLEENLNRKKQKIQDWRKISKYPFKLKYDEGQPKKIVDIRNIEEWQQKIKEEELEYIKNENELNKEKRNLLFYKKMDQHHEIYFNKNSTENLMDHAAFINSTFYYQHEIINKLNEEFGHI